MKHKKDILSSFDVWDSFNAKFNNCIAAKITDDLFGQVEKQIDSEVMNYAGKKINRWGRNSLFVGTLIDIRVNIVEVIKKDKTHVG